MKSCWVRYSLGAALSICCIAEFAFCSPHASSWSHGLPRRDEQGRIQTNKLLQGFEYARYRKRLSRHVRMAFFRSTRIELTFLRFRLSCTSAGSMKFHEFSRERGWKNPEDGNDTSMMKAYGTSMNFFSWLQHQGYGHHFSDHMGGRRLGRIPWMNSKLYPVQQRLIQGADTDPGRAFLVDIGGGAGHDLIEFRQHYPDAPGKLILQDLPAVLKQVEDLDPAIVCMEYDFFEEQPVKGRLPMASCDIWRHC